MKSSIFLILFFIQYSSLSIIDVFHSAIVGWCLLCEPAITTSVFDKFIYHTNGFDFEFEVLCKFAKLKYTVSEYKVRYFPRSFHEGKKLRAITDGTKIFKTILTSLIN